jgi:LacI family transcriptional regulator
MTMATIFDVAELAGVSIKTVSRVMNEEPSVRPRTRERVLAAIRELDYKPSSAARELRSGRSRSIGMLFGDPSSGFQSRLHHAALQACNNAGYFLAAGLFNEEADDWEEQVRAFLARTRVESMILVPPLCGSTVLHDHLAGKGIAFALISPSRPVPGAYSICMDDRGAAREITNHLIALGHRRIGHITGPPNHVATRLRREGFEDALVSNGIALPGNDWVQPGLFRFKEALQCAERMLTGSRRPTAIFAANDEMAAAVCFTANRLGLRVPDDLSVAGFDDVAIATTIWPPLTTIAQPYDAMADAAVHRLTQSPSRVEQNDDQKLIVLDYEFRPRSSTAPPPSGK